FFQAEDGIRYFHVTGVQTCALPISFVPSGSCHDVWHCYSFFFQCVEYLSGIECPVGIFFEEIQDKLSLAFAAPVAALVRVFRAELNECAAVNDYRSFCICSFFPLLPFVIDDIQMIHPSVALESSSTLELLVIFEQRLVCP